MLRKQRGRAGKLSNRTRQDRTLKGQEDNGQRLKGKYNGRSLEATTTTNAHLEDKQTDLDTTDWTRETKDDKTRVTDKCREY